MRDIPESLRIQKQTTNKGMEGGLSLESIEEMVKNLNPVEWEKQVYDYMCGQAQASSIG